MSQEENKVLTVAENIRQGYENALSAGEIAALAGIGIKPVREAISNLRKGGMPIITSPDGGYFIPRFSSERDIEITKEFLRQQQGQALERLKMCSGIREWIAAIRKEEN